MSVMRRSGALAEMPWCEYQEVRDVDFEIVCWEVVRAQLADSRNTLEEDLRMTKEEG